MSSRREWLREASAAAVLFSLPWSNTGRFRVPSAPKRILILGGTSFLGPALTETALGAGYVVTLFNRGITHPELFPKVERLRGYRDVDASQENFSTLAQRHWDAIIDVWPFEPAVAENAARVLRDRTPHYLYVSSVAAYSRRALEQPGATEDAELTPRDAAIAGYNRGKGESERRLRSILGDRLTIVRPGPIKGMRDTAQDLFTWLRRAEMPGPHIGPGTGHDEYFQFVDVYDVAQFLVDAIAHRQFGTFNLAGRSYSFREYLAACAASVGRPDEFIWIDRAFLDQHGLRPASDWTGPFPNWHPPPNRSAGFYRISSNRAFAVGWQQRSFRETALDCLAFFGQNDPGFQAYSDPLPPAREAEVISAWRQRR